MAPTAGTYRLAPDFQGCGHSDPDHSYEGGRVEFNGGKCDGWLLAGDNDAFAIGYYTKKDLAFLSGAATRWTVGDRYFSAIMAGTFANRIYQHAAQTDRLANIRAVYPANHLGSAGLGRRGRALLLQRPSVPGALGPTLPGHRPSDRAVLLDAAAGTLPAVSFLEPRFLGEEVGASNDDHPFADLRNGQAFMNAVYTAATTGPAWRDTVFVINYDEWAASSTTCPRPRRRFPPRIRSRATRWPARIPDAPAGDLAVRTARIRVEPSARPHLDSENDRMAVGIGFPARPRRHREQPRRRAAIPGP